MTSTPSINDHRQLTDGPGRPPRGDGLIHLLRSTRRFGPVLVLDIAMIIGFAITQPVFFTAGNFQNILTSVSIIWLIAMGMTFVLISAGFDLSAGAVATVAGLALSKLLAAGVPGVPAILWPPCSGACSGSHQRRPGRKLGLSVFVVTLGLDDRADRSRQSLEQHPDAAGDRPRPSRRWSPTGWWGSRSSSG